MLFLDGKGKHKIEQGEETKNKVHQWLLHNPNSTKMDCARALNLSYPAVLRHIKNIQIHNFENVRSFIDIDGMTKEFISKIEKNDLEVLENSIIKNGLDSSLFARFNLEKFCMDKDIVKKYAKSDEAYNCFYNDISGNIQMCFADSIKQESKKA